MSRNLPFVADGAARVHRAYEPAIRAEVEREFAARLALAGRFRRWMLRWAIAREVRRRLEKFVSPKALY